jgi:hypothetical protein
MHAAVQKKKKRHFNMKIVHHGHENNVFDCRGVFLYKIKTVTLRSQYLRISLLSVAVYKASN